MLAAIRNYDSAPHWVTRLLPTGEAERAALESELVRQWHQIAGMPSAFVDYFQQTQ